MADDDDDDCRLWFGRRINRRRLLSAAAADSAASGAARTTERRGHLSSSCFLQLALRGSKQSVRTFIDPARRPTGQYAELIYRLSRARTSYMCSSSGPASSLFVVLRRRHGMT